VDRATIERFSTDDASITVRAERSPFGASLSKPSRRRWWGFDKLSRTGGVAQPERAVLPTPNG